MTTKKKGTILVIVSLSLLPVILTLWAIFSAVISNMASDIPATEPTQQAAVVTYSNENEFGLTQIDEPLGERDSREQIASAVNVILSLGGIVAVLLLIIGLPIGIIFIVKGNKEEKEALQMNHHQPPQAAGSPPVQHHGQPTISGQPQQAHHQQYAHAQAASAPVQTMHHAYVGTTPDQQKYIKGASVAAFFNPFVWALGNKLYIDALLTLVPIYGIYMWFKLTIDGRRMAWENEKAQWSGFEEFRKRQKTAAWIVAIVTLTIIALQVMAEYATY